MTSERAQILSNEIKECIPNWIPNFLSKKQTPRNRQPPRRLQDLFGESTTCDRPLIKSPEEHYRVSTYYPSLSRVTAEMRSRFDSNEHDVLCGLGDIVLNELPKAESYDLIAKYYSVDRDLLEAEKKILQDFFGNQQGFVATD